MAKSKIILSLILITILGFVFMIGGTIPYFLLYIFLLTLILPLVHSIIVLRGLNGFVKIPETSLYTGDNINIGYQVNNSSFFPIPYLEIQYDITKQLTGKDSPNVILALDKKESFIRTEDISLKRRGFYELGEIKVVLRDVFELYTFNKKISSKASLLVYPDIIHLSNFKIPTSQESGELFIENSIFQDRSTVSSLREYREGDSVKSIHWKLTAKRDVPIVKDFESQGDINTIIFINNDKRHFEKDFQRRIEDKVVDIALSIVDYCLRNNLEITLRTQDKEEYIRIQGQYTSDLKPFLESLAKFKGNGLADFETTFVKEVEFIKKSSTVIIITPTLDKAIGAHGIQLKGKNLNPLFIVVTDIEKNNRNIDYQIEERLKQEGVPVYIIDYSISVKEALEV